MCMSVIIQHHNRERTKGGVHSSKPCGQSNRTKQENGQSRASESDRPADGELHSEAEGMIDDVQLKNGRETGADRA